MVMEEDIIEDILRLEEERDTRPQLGGRLCVSQPNLNVHIPSTAVTSFSCPFDLMQGRNEAPVAVPQQTEAYTNYRRRKESHNMFERRRRSVIRDRIRELATLLPRKNEPYFEGVRDRCNTGQILRSSVSYLRRLKLGVEHHKEVEARRHVLEEENQQLWSRVQKLETLLSKHDIKTDDAGDHGGDQGC